MPLLNDVHSRLNPTEVSAVFAPTSLDELQAWVKRAATSGQCISIAGGRHAMGGQQFAARALHLDTTRLTRVLNTDPNRGLIEVEAGIMWPALIAATHEMPRFEGTQWSIRQKQTGVDDVTLGGSVSASAHGRGLRFAPLGDDVEALQVILADGALVACSRAIQPELFSLVVGGYGLFAIIYAVTLRLVPRQKLVRLVDVLDIDDAARAVYRRIDEGCTYGDFQYAIDAAGENFMRKGVFACYKPAPENAPEPSNASDLPQDAWLKLLHLAHTDKARAFKIYAGHYLQTDGNTYWSDTMQLSTYIPTYVEFLQSASGARVDESLVIGEHYVPPEQGLAFIQEAGRVLRAMKVEVIYGTLRAISQDTTAFLAWARRDHLCTIFNLRTPHTPEGIAKTHETFRALSEISISMGGSFFLTYHRAATADQLRRAYPNIDAFFAKKRAWDPTERFQSDWYRQIQAALNA